MWSHGEGLGGKARHKSAHFSMLLMFLALSPAATLSSDAVDVAACSDSGYVTESLQCSSCSLLTDSGLSSLEEECKSCCSKDEETDGPTRYPFAELVVCS